MPSVSIVSNTLPGWASKRYPRLEMCFAGAWRTDDLEDYARVAGTGRPRLASGSRALLASPLRPFA